jgi:hypothetical protein
MASLFHSAARPTSRLVSALPDGFTHARVAIAGQYGSDQNPHRVFHHLVDEAIAAMWRSLQRMLSELR